MKRKHKIVILVVLLQIMLLSLTMVYGESIFEMVEKNLNKGMRSNAVGLIIGPAIMIVGIIFAGWDAKIILGILIRLFSMANNTGKGDKATGEKLSWKALGEIGFVLVVLILVGTGLIWGVFGTFNAIVKKTIPDVVPQIIQEDKDADEKDETTRLENYVNQTYFS